MEENEDESENGFFSYWYLCHIKAAASAG